MPALKPPPRQAPVTSDRIDCPRCGHKTLDPITLRCWCSAEFTPDGLKDFQSRPIQHARRAN